MFTTAGNYIAAQIIYNTRKIKQTNGRKKVMIHKYQCIPSQGKAYQDIHDQVCIGMPGVKESCRWSHKPSRGKYGISRHEFNTHWEKSEGDEDHDTSCREVLRMPSNSEDIEKKG